MGFELWEPRGKVRKAADGNIFKTSRTEKPALFKCNGICLQISGCVDIAPASLKSISRPFWASGVPKVVLI